MDWIRRLFNPDAYYGESASALTPAQRRVVELADELDALDPWDLPTVVAARELVADTAAVMPMVAVDAAGAVVDPTPSILRRPDPTEPYRRTIERIVNAMTRHGRAWFQIDAIGSTRHPIAGHVVDDARVVATTDLDHRITAITIDGIPVESRVLHIPMTVNDRHPLGVSPLQLIHVALSQLAEIYRFSAGYYSTAAIPPYSVVHPTRLTKPQAAEFSDQWLLARAERRPAILSGGVELATYTQTSAADALLLEAMGHLDQTVARAMQLPPSLLNVESASSLTYSTTQGEFSRWLAIGLYPMFLARIESAFTELLPRGQSAVMDTSNLTRFRFAGRVGADNERPFDQLEAGSNTRPPMELPR